MTSGSTSFLKVFKRTFASTRVTQWKAQGGHLCVELLTVDDIIRPELSGSRPFADYLVSTANEGLVGTLQPYFPRNGLLDRAFITDSSEWESSPNWKGMESGSNNLYPVQCIDGRVHAVCGPELREYLLDTYPVLETTSKGDELRCRTGEAVYSPSFGDLIGIYPKGIIHVVGPYHSKDNDWCELLCNSYFNSMATAVNRSEGMDEISVCCPFVSSGVRGVPLLESARFAAGMMNALEDLLQHHKQTMILKFATNEKNEMVIDQIRSCFMDSENNLIEMEAAQS